MAFKRKLSPLLMQSQKAFKKDTLKILTLASNEAVNFFHDNFRRQGFLNRSVKPWKPRKVVDAGRGILIGKGGGDKLSNSIARTAVSLVKKSATIGIKGDPIKYASVHNYGLMSGRGKGFKMPKRQFIGESKSLNKKIIRLIDKRLRKIM
jgi:phage gpG-like protein